MSSKNVRPVSMSTLEHTDLR